MLLLFMLSLGFYVTPAILGGGKGTTMGAIGGGGLALLASLAFSALQKVGQQPAHTPSALRDDDSAAHQQELENQSLILVKAMINAAKADGQIDENGYRSRAAVSATVG